MQALSRKSTIHPVLWAGSLLFLALFLLTGCFSVGVADQDGATSNIKAVVSADSSYSSYTEVLSSLLPEYAIEQYTGHAFTYLREGAIVEAFDAQAHAALATGNAHYWYPQYLATVVIAVDLDATEAAISSWNDLLGADERVGYNLGSGLSNAAFLAAMSYGLEGEGYTLKSAASLLAALQEQGRLATNSAETPLMICFDYQAAELARGGRNLEIVVPSEGTLSFERGLLSEREITFSGDADELLLRAGFRLTDGRSDSTLYPAAQDYASAARVTNYDHFNTTILDENSVIRRDVLHTRMYSSTDGREHQYWVLAYIILVVFWVTFILHRTIQKTARRAVLCIGLILIGWIIARLISYQLDNITVFSNTFWYSYYIFQLSLPLALLWLAQSVDKPEGDTALPSWLRVLAVINVILMVVVLTNTLHNLVYVYDYAKPLWYSGYTYGVLFYAVQIGCYLPLAVGIVMLFYQGRQSMKKGGILFIGALVLLLAAYAIGYVTRVPLAWDSDYTMVVGLFTLLFLEVSLRSGIIPVNSRYSELFKHSRLALRIFDTSGRAAFSSALAVEVDKATRLQALKSSPAPVHQDEHTLLYAAPVVGGYALWQEDISRLNRLQEELRESVDQLTAAHTLLIEEERIKRAAEEEKEKTQLLLHLEAEIADSLARLDAMAEELTGAARKQEAVAQIILQLAYIKRRCNLFFSEREGTENSPTFSTDELVVCLEELAELTSSLPIRAVITSEGSGTFSARQATLLYDFFYQFIVWAIEVGTAAESGAAVVASTTAESGSIVGADTTSVIAHLSHERGAEDCASVSDVIPRSLATFRINSAKNPSPDSHVQPPVKDPSPPAQGDRAGEVVRHQTVALKLLVSENAHAFLPDEGLMEALHAEGAFYHARNLDDDTLSLTLSFQEGGEGCA